MSEGKKSSVAQEIERNFFCASVSDFKKIPEAPRILGSRTAKRLPSHCKLYYRKSRPSLAEMWN